MTAIQAPALTGVRLRGALASLFTIALTLSLAMLVIARSVMLRWSTQTLAQVACLAVIGCWITVLRFNRRRFWSAGFLYLLLLSLFHFGVIAYLALAAPLPPAYAPYAGLWLYSSYMPETIYLCLLATVAFTTAYVWLQRKRQPVEQVAPKAPAALTQRFGRWLLIVGIVGYVAYIDTVAPQLLHGGSYADYLQAVPTSSIPSLLLMAIGFGLVVVAGSPSAKSRTVCLIAFGLFALFVLNFGSRTTALVPAVAGAIAMARTHRMPRTVLTVAVLIVSLVGISAVRQLRGPNEGPFSLNPLGAVVELGTTVRGVEVAVSLQRGLGLAPQHGQTYITASERIYEKLAGTPRPPGDQDPRYAQTIVNQAVPDFNIGFTPVGEAFLNFGTTGVLVIFLLIGLLFGALDRWRRNDMVAITTIGVVAFAFSYDVRQASNWLTLTFIAGAALILFVSRLERPMGQRALRRLRSAGAVY